MIFSAGAPVILHLLGMEAAEQALSGPLGTTKILTAFSVSLTMNTMFAPIMMIAHKVADLHIAQYQGRLACLWNAPQTGRLLQSVDWNGLLEKRAVPLPALVLDPGPYRDVPVAPVLPCPVRGCPWERSWGCCWPCCCLKAERRPHSARRFPEGRTGAIPPCGRRGAPVRPVSPSLHGTGERPAGCTQKSPPESSPAGFLSFFAAMALSRGAACPPVPRGEREEA